MSKRYTIKFIGKRAYKRIFDNLADIADMSYYNTDDNWTPIS